MPKQSLDALKNLIDDESLLGQIEQALANKQFNIADLTSGEYVSKSKYLDAVRTRDELKTQLAERDLQLQALQALKPEEMQSRLAQLQTENARKDQEYQAKLAQFEMNSLVSSALANAKVRDPAVVQALLKPSTLSVADGQLIGFNEQITALKAAHPYLFTEDAPAAPATTGTGFASAKPPVGTTPAATEGTPSAAAQAVNSFIRARMTPGEN